MVSKFFLKYFLIGCILGLVDVMPGLSGGTILFLFGIWEQVIKYLSRLDFYFLKQIFKFKLLNAWEYCNGKLFFSLLLGNIITQVFFAKLILNLLNLYSVQFWAFITGITIVLIFLLYYQIINKLQRMNYLALLLGFAFLWFIFPYLRFNLEINYLNIIFAGLLATSVMLLPGLSGSSVLNALNFYEYYINMLANLIISDLMLFLLGAILSIVFIIKIINKLHQKYPCVVHSFCFGLVIASLKYIWPWKVNNQLFIINPSKYAELSNSNPLVLQLIIFLGLGISIAIIVNFFYNKIIAKKI